jgi:hypothetical protein
MKCDWVPEFAEEEDKIVCPKCGGAHKLVQGKINSVRLGDGVLFFKCGGRDYIGAIYHKTAFGVNLCKQ